MRQNILELLFTMDGADKIGAPHDDDQPLSAAEARVLQQGASEEAQEAPHETQPSAAVGGVMAQRRRPERCFRCFREFKEVTTQTWRCSAVFADGGLCDRAFCGECILTKKPHDQNPRDGFCCTVHQQRPDAKASGLFPGGPTCFYCPIGLTARARHQRKIRCCQWCSKALCPQCGVFQEALLASKTPYTCPGCLATSEDINRMETILLGHLGTITGRRYMSIDECSRTDLEAKRLTREQLRAAHAFSDYVNDVWRAGWHEIAEPFVEKLLMMNLNLRTNGHLVVTTYVYSPSRPLRG